MAFFCSRTISISISLFRFKSEFLNSILSPILSELSTSFSSFSPESESDKSLAPSTWLLNYKSNKNVWKEIFTFDKLGDLFLVSIFSVVGNERLLTGRGTVGSWFGFLCLRWGGEVMLFWRNVWYLYFLSATSGM